MIGALSVLAGLLSLVVTHGWAGLVAGGILVALLLAALPRK